MHFSFIINIRAFLVALFILSSAICSGQEKHAILVGIGNYPIDSGWNEIHGNNDISILETRMIEQGVLPENIIKLVDNQATKSGICEAFERTLTKVKKDDVVYVHFSGHGQQVTDLNGDEEDGWDEAWIPYDARKEYQEGVYEGENHLIDDELNKILMRFRVKIGPSGKLVIVADACHSGSGTRGLHDDDDDDFVRGTGDRFTFPQTKYNIHPKAVPEEWLYVAACKPNESNHEYKAPTGIWYGTLSYVISQDDTDFTKSKYVDVLKIWNETVRTINKRSKDITNDGRPSKRSSYLF